LVTIQYYWHFSYHQSCWALLRYLVKPFLLDKTPLLLLLDTNAASGSATGKRLKKYKTRVCHVATTIHAQNDAFGPPIEGRLTGR
jgi:hypothetical protein